MAERKTLTGNEKTTEPQKPVAKRAKVLKRVEIARERLERIPATAKVKQPIGGFLNFVREQGVVGLAIGLVIGTQVKTLVDQLVTSFINPILGLVLPGSGNLAEKKFFLQMNGKGEDFLWGAFASQLISFLTVAAVIYFAFKGLKLDRLDKKKE